MYWSINNNLRREILAAGSCCVDKYCAADGVRRQVRDGCVYLCPYVCSGKLAGKADIVQVRECLRANMKKIAVRIHAFVLAHLAGCGVECHLRRAHDGLSASRTIQLEILPLCACQRAEDQQPQNTRKRFKSGQS